MRSVVQKRLKHFGVMQGFPNVLGHGCPFGELLKDILHNRGKAQQLDFGHEKTKILNF